MSGPRYSRNPQGATRITMAANFLARYGADALRQLLWDFQAGVNHQVSADRLGVSRTRVMEWSRAFGRRVSAYVVDERLRAVIDPQREFLDAPAEVPQ